MPFPKICRHPITALFIVVIACRVWRDFYPLNSFPMYADPGPEASEYVILRDGDGALVDIQRLTGETSAKVKKKYVKERNELATKAGIEEAATAGPEICAQAWDAVAARLQKLAQRRKKSLPATLRMELGLIYQEQDGFREEVKEIGRATIHPKAQP